MREPGGQLLNETCRCCHRHVARTGALAELTREELVGYLVPAIRALLAPAIAAAEVAQDVAAFPPTPSPG
jgi:hypothetical protein